MVNADQQVPLSTEQLNDLAQFKTWGWGAESTQELSVKMDETLARILLTNLIKNAIVHNSNGGWVKELTQKYAIVIAQTAL